MVDYGLMVYFCKIALACLIMSAVSYPVALAFEFVYKRLPLGRDDFAAMGRAVFICIAALAGVIAVIFGFIACIMWLVTIL